MTTQSMGLSQPYGARPNIIAAIASVFLAFVVFSGGLAELVNRWNRQEEYSYGFLIPFVVVWLLWNRRKVLSESFGLPSWLGLVLIAVAIGMHLIGDISTTFILSQLGFVLALIGIILAAGGYSLLRVTSVPILFLIFAIPLPYFIDAKLTLQLQLISSQLGAEVIRLFGVPVFLEGNVIDLGDYRLLVIEACSGLRYLFPLLGLGFLASYFFNAPLWQRAILFFSTIPISVLMNSLRIGLVGVTMDIWGKKMADGVLHYFEGWTIFIACAGILLCEIFLMARLSGKSFSQTFDLPRVEPVRTPDSQTRFPAAKGPLIASLLILCAAGLASLSLAHRPETPSERSRFIAFPQNAGPWHGQTSSLDEATAKSLGLDDYVLANFSKGDGKPVNLYVAYYASQRTGLSPHSPTVCLPGDGWLITTIEKASFDSPNGRQPMNKVVIQRDSAKQIVYYWFQERGRTIADEWLAKYYLLSDAITMNRTDGALVRVTTSVAPGEPESAAEERLQSFIQSAVPILGPFLPSDRDTIPKRLSTVKPYEASKS